MLILVGLTVIAVADIIIVSNSSGMAIVAFRLEEEPDTFFILEDPDPFVLKAIDNEGEPVFMGLFGNTQIDELITLHNTGNVAYLGEFYVIGWLSADAFSYGLGLLLVSIVGWLLLLSFGITLIYDKDTSVKK